MEQVVPSSSTDGRVILEPPIKKKKQVSPSKHWCFTYFHYPENWKEIIVPKFKEKLAGYVVGEEVCPKTGQPHLQGYIEFKEKARPMGLLPKEVHWEARKGTLLRNQEYCSKEGKWVSGGTCYIRPVYKVDIELMNWQKEIVQILKCEPDDRTIHWYWRTEGNAGKTTFQKWIFLNYELTIVLSGKASDMKNGIIQFEQTNKTWPKIVLIDIPKSQDVQCISWQGIEEIKNMFFYSGKYEGGMVCGPSPHVLIFSNKPPPEERLSEDRWHIVELD